MQLIFLSPPTFVPHEIAGVMAILSQDIYAFHIRKPGADKRAMAQYISQIPTEYHHKLMLHSHHSLIADFNIKGLHFTSQNPYAPFAALPACVLSQSVHTMEEILQLSPNIHYALWAPIFPSISKKGHAPIYSPSQIQLFLRNYTGAQTLFALGGIDNKTIVDAKAWGFKGAAILGAIWQ